MQADFIDKNSKGVALSTASQQLLKSNMGLML
jgi:hypothetical protein